MKNTDSRSRQCDVCRIRKTPGVFSYIFIKDSKYTFAACIDCCVARISLKAEADAIKEEAKIKVQHEGHPHHTLSLQLRLVASGVMLAILRMKAYSMSVIVVTSGSTRICFLSLYYPSAPSPTCSRLFTF
ncbi:unnamed protein product [Lactuca saligna]|uniref:Uncharacterized protein n=1 Tax=Lactuca saligna TaxID=75948 RepID=A0AA35ZFG9_LACSI|nr:unnamed protein product [Lactuca saligna]